MCYSAKTLITDLGAPEAMIDRMLAWCDGISAHYTLAEIQKHHTGSLAHADDLLWLIARIDALKTQGIRCPSCGSTDIIPLPDYQLQLASARTVSMSDCYHCRACSGEFALL